MFDIGWTELLVIGVVALIVVGPKDLPKMFKTLGQMTAKARNMAREFQRAMEDAADASGVKDVARDLRGMTDTQGMGLDELKKFKNWDPLKSDDPAAKAKTPAVEPEAEDDIDTIAAEMDTLRGTKAKAATPATKPAPATPAPAPAPTAGDDPTPAADPDAHRPKA